MSLQVAVRVTSKEPLYLLFGVLQATWAFCGARAQLAECPGVSISGTTLTPLTMAQCTRCLTSAGEKVSRRLKLAWWASSGCPSSRRGKESSSVMCQCSTLSLLYIMASMVSRMSSRGRKCLAVSIISPRNSNTGWSLMEMGTAEMPQSRQCLSQVMACMKVSSALTNPTQCLHSISACYFPMRRLYFSSSTVKALLKAGSAIFIFTTQDYDPLLVAGCSTNTNSSLLQLKVLYC